MAAILDFAKSFSRSNYDSPPYEVVQKFENGIEERVYPGQKWAVTETEVKTGEHEASTTDMFWALFGYISGKNEKSQKISMTVPVSTEVIPVPNPGSSEAENKELRQMGFYVPKEFQNDPPVPSDSRVKIVSRDLTVYVITFSGYMKGTVAQKQLQELTKFLDSKNLAYETKEGSSDPVHYDVGYDSPQKFWDRKNEVWVLKKMG